MRNAVHQSLALDSTPYPRSSITVTLIGSSTRLTGPEGVTAAPAAVHPTGNGVIYEAAIVDDLVGLLPSDLGFLLTASPALLVPRAPFGAGLTAQACDSSGKVINLIGEQRDLNDRVAAALSRLLHALIYM
jgi:hypothetical protein